ncbi:MAG TPA: antibiotic biosynthesis monooxygenase [Micromonosporaceae bacterium]|nr:antibiotic biosynthesis monooxygenase [Micromonosporaceae bacterium]
MSGLLRVLLYHAASDPAGIDAAYHEVSRRLAPVPGLIGNELLRSVADPTDFVVVSSWRDLAAFREWEHGPEHRESTAPLRPYRQAARSTPFGIYEVTAAF